MNSRTIIGAISIGLFCKEFVSINQIPFDYHNQSIDSDQPVTFKKGTYLISFKYFQHVLNKYENPQIGDLVIVEQPDKSVKFKIVEASPKSYFSESEKGVYYYVPNGFVVVNDPETNTTKMEFIANVRGCDHHPLKF